MWQNSLTVCHFDCYIELVQFRRQHCCFYAETIANPALTVLDIQKWATVAHQNNVPLVVDNTFATPYLCRPFEWGADIVIHSTSKYMDGHAVQCGGVVVDSGNFDWEVAYKRTKKFCDMVEPDGSYHGLCYSTHRQLTDAQLVAAGIDAGLVRVSVGLENVEDIIADLKQALEKI